MNWLYQKWWKWVCVLLLLYVTIGGLVVPLGSGITAVTPAMFNTRNTTPFQLSGYHTHFTQQDMQVWFKNGSTYYCADSVFVQSDNSLVAHFGIDTNCQLTKRSFDVIINNAVDGTVVLRDAITILNDTNSTVAESFIASTTCTPSVNSNKQAGLVFPYREILYESIRNTFFHVPMWFVMTILAFTSLIASVLYLIKGDMKWDIVSHQSIVVALVFGICGLLTGMLWANYTWGRPWVNDPKLNGAAVGVMIYFAYLVLRGSIADEIKRARIAAVYNVFGLVIFILFIYIIPRLTDSLHPGNGGNPAFSKYDLDSSLRMFFYPASIGWILLGFWIMSLLVRIQFVRQKSIA